MFTNSTPCIVRLSCAPPPQALEYLHDQHIALNGVAVDHPAVKDTMPIAIPMNRVPVFHTEVSQVLIVNVQHFHHQAPRAAAMKAFTFAASFFPG